MTDCQLKSTSVSTRNVAIAQRDGRPAEYRWRPLFNAAVWLDAHYYTVSQKSSHLVTACNFVKS